MEAADRRPRVEEPAASRLLAGSCQRLAVSAYHGIDDSEEFAAHLDVIRTSTQPVSLDDVVDAVESGRPLPPHSTLVTFDDGRVSVRTSGSRCSASAAFPPSPSSTPVCWTVRCRTGGMKWPSWLPPGRAARHVPADPGPLTSPQACAQPAPPRADRRAPHSEARTVVIGEQLRSSDLPGLEAAGVAVGNHSLTHPCLDQCTAQEIDREVEEGHRLLTDALAIRLAPSPIPTATSDARTVDAVERTGYEVVRLGPPARAPPSRQPPADPPDPGQLHHPRSRASAPSSAASTLHSCGWLQPCAADSPRSQLTSVDSLMSSTSESTLVRGFGDSFKSGCR